MLEVLVLDLVGSSDHSSQVAEVGSGVGEPVAVAADSQSSHLIDKVVDVKRLAATVVGSTDQPFLLPELACSIILTEVELDFGKG